MHFSFGEAAGPERLSARQLRLIEGSLTNCSNRVSFRTPIQKVSFVPPLGFLAGCGEKRIRLRGCCNSERLESALRRGDSARLRLPNNPAVKLIVAECLAQPEWTRYEAKRKVVTVAIKQVQRQFVDQT